ncbi:hypothetical protein BBJ28_00015055 [Nothophytophthora sp. Chile5]|nr:hypothetical protein BBJ28_00015055 [Nothophytophthora sp. Chile5]
MGTKTEPTFVTPFSLAPFPNQPHRWQEAPPKMTFSTLQPLATRDLPSSRGDWATGLAVWAVEAVGHTILLFLDVPSLDNVLQSIQATPSLSGYLQDGALWNKLLHLHFGGERVAELHFLPLPVRDRGCDWTSSDRTCVELQDFLRSADEYAQFEKTVVVREGNIGWIDDIEGTPLDGIVFPTNSYLTNNHVGAAGAVFRRAGEGLLGFVNDPSFRGSRPVGSAVVTPAFEAGVDRLIHCVGPHISYPDCYELLASTYENAMTAIVQESLTCVTMASISTGSLDVPCKEGAQVALRTIQNFLRANHWEGKLAIVCYERRVLRAFTDEKRAVLENFNATPPLPISSGMFPWA